MNPIRTLVVCYAVVLFTPPGLQGEERPLAPIDLGTGCVAASGGPGYASAAVLLGDGSLESFFRKSARGDVSIFRVRSTDDGRHWSDMEAVVSLSLAPWGGPMPLLGREGELHFVIPRARGEGRKPNVDRFIDLYYVRSTDGRTRWSMPTRIYEGYCGAIQGLFQLAGGRIIAPFAEWLSNVATGPPAGAERDDLRLFGRWRQHVAAIAVAVDRAVPRGLQRLELWRMRADAHRVARRACVDASAHPGRFSLRVVFRGRGGLVGGETVAFPFVELACFSGATARRSHRGVLEQLPDAAACGQGWRVRRARRAARRDLGRRREDLARVPRSVSRSHAGRLPASNGRSRHGLSARHPDPNWPNPSGFGAGHRSPASVPGRSRLADGEIAGRRVRQPRCVACFQGHWQGVEILARASAGRAASAAS